MCGLQSRSAKSRRYSSAIHFGSRAVTTTRPRCGAEESVCARGRIATAISCPPDSSQHPSQAKIPGVICVLNADDTPFHHPRDQQSGLESDACRWTIANAVDVRRANPESQRLRQPNPQRRSTMQTKPWEQSPLTTMGSSTCEEVEKGCVSFASGLRQTSRCTKEERATQQYTRRGQFSAAVRDLE